MTRLFGVRDFGLGLALWSAQNRTSGPAAESVARNDFRGVLWAGVLIDAVDVCSVVACMFDATVSTQAMIVVGAGAASFVCAGLAGIYGL